MPTVTGMDGCMGMSMLVNRETGHGIATTSWMSEDDMRATEGQVSPFRSRGAEIMGGDWRSRSGRSRSCTASTTHERARGAGSPG